MDIKKLLLYCTLYCTVLYCSVLYCTVLYPDVRWRWRINGLFFVLATNVFRAALAAHAADIQLDAFELVRVNETEPVVHRVDRCRLVDVRIVRDIWLLVRNDRVVL